METETGIFCPRLLTTSKLKPNCFSIIPLQYPTLYNGFQLPASQSSKLWRWWWTLNKFGSLQTSHRSCEKRQRRRVETFALLSFLILLCQDIYTIFRGNSQMSNISMKLSLKHGMINERSKHGNEAQIIYCGIFGEKSYFIITLIQQNIHSFMVIWPRSEN